VVFDPSLDVRDEVEKIAKACAADMGSVEYLVDKYSGKRYYFDVNMLSTLPPANIGEFDSYTTQQSFVDPAYQFAEFVLHAAQEHHLAGLEAEEEEREKRLLLEEAALAQKNAENSD